MELEILWLACSIPPEITGHTAFFSIFPSRCFSPCVVFLGAIQASVRSQHCEIGRYFFHVGTFLFCTRARPDQATIEAPLKGVQARLFQTSSAAENYRTQPLRVQATGNLMTRAQGSPTLPQVEIRNQFIINLTRRIRQ